MRLFLYKRETKETIFRELLHIWAIQGHVRVCQSLFRTAYPHLVSTWHSSFPMWLQEAVTCSSHTLVNHLGRQAIRLRVTSGPQTTSWVSEEVYHKLEKTSWQNGPMRTVCFSDHKRGWIRCCGVLETLVRHRRCQGHLLHHKSLDYWKREWGHIWVKT